MIKQLNAENYAELKRLKKELDDLTVDTHIKCIQEVFDNAIIRGFMYCFAALTGTGKTTLLLAIAKKLARQGKRVTFITTEQSIGQMVEKIGLAEELPSLSISDDLNDILHAKEYPDYVIYDYVETNAEVDKLAEYCEAAKCVLFTACQAVLELASNYKECPLDPSLGTPMYVDYPRGTSKFAGCAYLLKDGTLINFRNLYGEHHHRSSVKIDFVHSEIIGE